MEKLTELNHISANIGTLHKYLGTVASKFKTTKSFRHTFSLDELNNKDVFIFEDGSWMYDRDLTKIKDFVDQENISEFYFGYVMGKINPRTYDLGNVENTYNLWIEGN